MRLFSIVIMAAFVLALSACNTIEGMGKDIKQAGNGIEKAADRSK